MLISLIKSILTLISFFKVRKLNLLTLTILSTFGLMASSKSVDASQMRNTPLNLCVSSEGDSLIMRRCDGRANQNFNRDYNNGDIKDY